MDRPEEKAKERYPSPPWDPHYATGYATCWRENVEKRDQDIAALKLEIERLNKVVVAFNPDSDAIIDGAGDTWKAAGYEDTDRAEERFRGGLRQAFIVGWHESRLHLAGKSALKSKREIELEQEIDRLKGIGGGLDRVYDEVKFWADHWKLEIKAPKDETSKLAALSDLYDRLKALYTRPADLPAIVDKIMEVVDEWLWHAVPDNQTIRHPLGSKYRTDQPAQDALRTRLTDTLGK